jgi:hypothetical protein
VYRRFAKDPLDLVAVMRCFLNDRPGGFHTCYSRLPVRFFVLPYDLLLVEEKLMVARRVLDFVSFWKTKATPNIVSPDSPVFDFFEKVNVLDSSGVMRFLESPPSNFVPESEF